MQIKCSYAPIGQIESGEYPTVLEGLADNRILKITREPNGEFCLTEGCDDYFFVHLTSDQLSTLGHELIELSMQVELK